MVNLSPDMVKDGAWNSGYRYHRDSIHFFSHIHAWQISGIPVMATTGKFKGHLGSEEYRSSYHHDTENTYPGYHKIHLEDYNITAELTSTTRVGFHKYTFPASDSSFIFLDLGTVLGPSGTDKGMAKRVSDQEIQGYALMGATSRRPKATYVYYSIVLDKKPTKINTWQHNTIGGELNRFEGAGGGVYFHFKTYQGEEVKMKVGISYVSADQARKNIEAELTHWNFEKVVNESRSEWNKLLGRIEVKGNSKNQIRRFYTDLWKSLQGRRIISDANGKYCDMTGDTPAIKQIPLDDKGKPAFNHYNSDSFWGAQWTITTLWQLVYPGIAEEFINSMLLMYQDGGLIPRGPSGGNYTYVMTGASSTPFIVGAYMKGIRGYDIKAAFEGIVKNGRSGGIMAHAGYEHDTKNGGGLEEYVENGYVPYPLSNKRWGGHQDGAGQTLEYSFQDWCVAQMAKKQGNKKIYNEFIKRSHHWKNIFDQEINWIRPKDHDGNWKTPYDPYEYRNGFVESNGAQATWYVPHDLMGLSQLMGGNEKASAQLNSSFEEALKLDFTSGKSHSAETERKNRRIPINYGNQPSIQSAFVFNYFQKPWLTQYWSRQVLQKAFSGLSPESGYNGDEDQGLMGSLAVLMKIGLFEMHAGCAQNPYYDIGSPIFDEIIIHLDQDYYPGKNLKISVENNSYNSPYIQQAIHNGSKLQSAFIFHSELVKGGHLSLKMGNTPNKNWGSSNDNNPGLQLK